MTRSLALLPFALLATPAMAETPAAWTASPAEQAMVRALSIRDPAPSCETVEALADADVVASLTAIVDNVSAPPWAGMRAASCLATRHAEAAQATLAGWVVDPGKKGLAILVMNQLDQMPQPVAMDLAGKALAGPLADDARRRVLRAETPEIRALAEQQ